MRSEGLLDGLGQVEPYMPYVLCPLRGRDFGELHGGMGGAPVILGLSLLSEAR